MPLPGRPTLPSSNCRIAAAPDELRTQSVLRPAEGIGEAGSALAAGVLRDRAGEVCEVVPADAAGIADHLGGVAGVVPLENLEHRLRVLQGLVAQHPGVRQHRAAAAVRVAGRAGRGTGAVLVAAVRRGGAVLCVSPRRRVVVPGLRVDAGEQAAEFLGVAEVRVHQGRRVGIRDDVLLEPQVVGEHVVDQRAEQHHVRAGPDRNVFVRDRRGTGEPRVDVDDLSPAGPGLLHPLEANGMALGHVGPLDDDAVGIGHVLQALCGAAAPERGSQTGNRGGVSNARLVFDLDRASGREELLDQVVLFVVQGRAAQGGDAHRAAQQAPLVIALLPGAAA